MSKIAVGRTTKFNVPHDIMTDVNLITYEVQTCIVRISDHPYFAKRTKSGKPYKRREKLLKKLIAEGIDGYMAQQVVVMRDGV